MVNVFLPIAGRSGNWNKSKHLFESNFGEVSREIRKINKKDNLWIEVVFYFKGVYFVDLDNLLKSLLDSLQIHQIIINDRLIKSIDATIQENSLLEGISLKIGLWDNDNHLTQ